MSYTFEQGLADWMKVVAKDYRRSLSPKSVHSTIGSWRYISGDYSRRIQPMELELIVSQVLEADNDAG